uniref:Uncharacterized protein n=2 Tax=Tetranychus urticae TaxID=32264 RepID=T1L0X8_TETUR
MLSFASLDTVIRNSYYKYLHPKEALINNGILNRGILTVASKLKNLTDSGKSTSNIQFINYVYPYGASLNVTKPGIGILSTGSVCYPLNRPTIAFYTDKATNGKLIVIGSSQMFTDTYIEKEDNSLIKDIILEYLLEPIFPIDQIDAEDPEISDYHTVPDITLLSEEPLSCLQEIEDAPSDYTKLFSKELYEIDNTLLAKVILAYKEFHMEKEPLKLIKPQFEAPLPNLEPAVFPPNFRFHPKPDLELYDLDQAFSSIPARLTQVVNKCTDDDLDYYIKECAMVLGLQGSEKMSSKEILNKIFNKIVLYKKVNIDKD